MADANPAPGADLPALPELEDEIRTLVVEALMLEDVTPADIDPAAPLFGNAPGSLGLDSIDVLELAMALHKRFGVRTRSDDERNREVFYSVRTLAHFVAQQRAPQENAS
ncbi:MAG: acyl carrier protein [Deltaproteobacteria bacterium]|nr:MAG: acyl carrier protein [Deltaproteobacteria bacterium]